MNNGNMFGDIYDIIRKNLVLLIAVIVVSAIAAAVFSSSLFLKPRYKSMAAVYPINTISHSDESETEQMLQIFGSEEIKESVLNTFELWKRWDDLVPGEPEYRHWSNLLYDERVSIGPNRYESVEIVCQDENPDTAKFMVEHIVNKYNEVARNKDREIHVEYLKMKEYELQNLAVVIDSLEGRLRELRMSGGIMDFETQSERLMEGYMSMLESGAGSQKLAQVSAMMANMAKDGSEVEILQEALESFQNCYTELTKEKVQAMSKANSQLNYAVTVVEAQVADKKSYPVRWVIVLLSVIFGGLAALIFIIFKERMGRQAAKA